MSHTFTLSPGITLHCVRDSRFKQGCLSIQFLRVMDAKEAALNALLPAILLRGTQKHKDLRAITRKLDDLYGASVSTLVRRIGDYQTTGLYCAFMEDRFALEGDQILRPMLEFVRELLLEPLTQDGGFFREYVESEKRNLVLTMESEINDKRTYAAGQLLRTMCSADSFGIPRLGEKDTVAAIDHKNAYEHYQALLRDSEIAIFYVGSADAEQMAELLTPIFAGLSTARTPLPPQTPFRDGGGQDRVETLDVTQAKLGMGFTTPITNQSPDFAAMQVCNTLFGGGMTSKLFQNLRETMSLCYSIGSGYYGSKGILTVNAGIDAQNEEISRQEILRQLSACQQGQISDAELQSAKEAILSALRGVHDSPGAIENYYATHRLSNFPLSLEEHYEAVSQVSIPQVAAAARSLQLHSSYFLKGVQA